VKAAAEKEVVLVPVKGYLEHQNLVEARKEPLVQTLKEGCPANSSISKFESSEL
jgi:hypothetical protein